MSLNNENKNFRQKGGSSNKKVKKKNKSEGNKGENEFQGEKKKENESEKTNSQYISSKDNIDNLNELRNNLKGKNKYIDKYQNVLTNYELDNKNIKLCYENEENMNKYLEKKLIEKNDAFKLDNELFELQAKRIFSEVYELKEKILYPYFSVEYSQNKRANTIKIYYYKIEIKSGNNNPICFSFPEIKDTFLINFEEKPIIIEKKGDDDFVMSVISKDFNHSIDFQFIKKDDFFQTSLIHADISDELFQSEENVKETRNKIDSLNNIENKEEENKNNKIDEIHRRRDLINNNEENSKQKQINDKKTQENIQEDLMNINNKEDEKKIPEEKSEINNIKDKNREIFNNNNEKNSMDNNNTSEVNCEVKSEEKEIKEEEKLDEKRGDNSIQKSSEKETLKKKLKIYEIKLKHTKEKYSEENITRKLNKKNEELEILNLEMEIDGNKDDLEEKKNALKKEIKEYEKLLKTITVTIKKSDQEFDGLYISKKEFVLKNSLGYEITIPANSFVIVEVKNHNNYFDLTLNLEKKGKILNSIGFPLDKFFFVGILRSVDEERKKNGQLRKLKSKNMIIIYPDKSTFLGIPLFDEKIEKKTKEEKKDKAQSFKDEVDKSFQEVIIEMINNLSNEIKEIKNNMNKMGKDIDYLKNKIDKKEN